MAGTKGVSVVVKVRTSTGPDVYTLVAGQRGGTLNIGTSDIDTSNKDGAGWEERIAGLRNWSIDCDGLHSESDTGLQKLENEIIAGNTVRVQFVMASGAKFQGDAIISDYKIDAPHDDVVTMSAAIKGTGALSEV
jgi:TP901-1 family phage major tail protein